ncbi:MAG TPA: AMP-binding protein [Bacteroidia bacterium]|jgi:amino acid adenylation domain-containing protein
MSRPLHQNEPLALRIKRLAPGYALNPAIHVGGQYYTYAELMLLVEKIRGMIPVDKSYQRIAVFCNDDIYTYASILAINLYGAAYVPLNRKYPRERNRLILQESKSELILGPGMGSASELASELKVINTAGEDHTGQGMQDNRSSDQQDLCYILFTSGSTGEPKGVPVSNSNLNAFFSHFLRNYDFNSSDRFLQTYELTFDVSVFSFFMPLLVGACCYILPDEGIKPVKMIEHIRRFEITVVSMVPGVLKYLEKYLPEIKAESLRYSFFSGDALQHALAAKWQQCIGTAKIHNCYGPAETTIVCTSYIFDESISEKESVNGIVPLGKPFEGMEFMIINESNEKVTKGELCFSGDQLIRSYTRDEHNDRFFDHDGKRFYKTGDLAGLNGSGNLVFYGRADSQVKIDGYRVELGEIEHVLRKLCGFNTKVLTVPGDGNNRLAAFIEAEVIDLNRLKEALAATLPAYMVPRHFFHVASFPLNTNGKTDLKALKSLYLKENTHG